MLAEVKYGYVDASIGGFSTNLERFELVEFSQNLVGGTLGLTIKTPDKSDQVSYFSRKQNNVDFILVLRPSEWIIEQASLTAKIFERVLSILLGLNTKSIYILKSMFFF